MIIKLLNDIISYIEYLKGLGFHITVHDRNVNFCNYMYIISKYNIHDNPFCLAVKANPAAWQHCTDSHPKVYEHLSKTGPLWGMCWAGIEEYVFPIKNEEILGFISVSGYGIDRSKAVRRMERISKEYITSRQDLEKIYDKHLIHIKPSFSELSCLIQPLCYMLLYLYEFVPKEVVGQSNEDLMYGRVISFINKNYANKITLKDISRHCSCSISSISHCFRKRSGYTISEYINNIRLLKAEKFLIYSKYSINDIASMTGFEDSNYFSTAFKRKFNISPMRYRKINMKDV